MQRHLLPAIVTATLLFFFASSEVWAQGSRKDDLVISARGLPLAGATIRVCTAVATGQPCSPLALIYSDTALTQAKPNPTATDGLGNYNFYAPPGRYLIEISGPQIITRQIPDVILPSDPSNPSFATVTSTGAISAFSLTLTGNLTVQGSASVVGNLSASTLALTNQATPPGAAAVGTVNVYTKSSDKRLYYKDDAGAETGPLGTGGGSGAPGGSNTQVQFNDSGVLGGDAGLLYDKVTKALSISGPLRVKSGAPWFDVTHPDFSASGSAAQTTGSITASSTTLTLAAASDFRNGQGVAVFGAGPTPTLSVPGAPTITPQGTPGSTSYSYKVVAIDTSGGVTAASAAGSTSTGNAALSLTNFNRVTWTEIANAVMYVVYGRTGGAFNALTVIGPTMTGTTVSWNDFGFSVPVPAYVPSSAPASATGQFLIATISSGGGTTALNLANAASNTVTGATVQHDDTAAIRAAIIEAKGAGGQGGVVYFPRNLYFRFTDLNLPNLGTVGSVWIILKFAGRLLPNVPIEFNQGGYALVGESNAANLVNFMQKPASRIEHNNLNPVIWVTESTSSPIWIKAINIDGCVGDGLRADRGFTNLFLEDINIRSHDNANGSPILINQQPYAGFTGGGFGLYGKGIITNGTLNTNYPAIDLQDQGVIDLENVFLGGRRLRVKGNLVTNGVFGGFRLVQVLSENMKDNEILDLDLFTGNVTQSWAIHNVEIADNIASPVHFLTLRSGAIQGLFLSGVRGMTGGGSLCNIVGGSITNTFAIDTEPPSGGCGLADGNRNVMQFRDGHLAITGDGHVMGGATTGNSNVPLTVKAITAPGVPLIVQGAASQSGDLQQWKDSGGANLAKVNNFGDFSARSVVASTSGIDSRFGTLTQEFGNTTVNMKPAAANGSALGIREHPGQTGDSFFVTNSTGTNVFRVQAGGAVATAGRLTVGTGVGPDGGGFKHVRVSTGSISGGGRADVTVTWTTAFADANYTANCAVEDASAAGTGLEVERIRSRAAGLLVVQVFNESGGALTGTLHCQALHD